MLLAARDAVFRMMDGYGTDFLLGSSRDVAMWNPGIGDPPALSVMVDFIKDRRAAVDPFRFPVADAMAPWFRITKISG